MDFKIRPFHIILGILFLAALSYRLYLLSIPMPKRLTSLDDSTRNVAIADMVKFKQSTKERLVIDLLPYMSPQHTPDPKARRYAAYAIRKLGGHSKEVVGMHIAALSDTDKDIQEEAMTALIDLGEIAVPHLIDLFMSPNISLHAVAVDLLLKIGQPALPGLRATLKSDSPVAVLAATTLKKMSTEAKDALPDLLPLLNSKDKALRVEAALAINAIQSTPVVKGISDILAQAIDESSWDEKSVEIVRSLRYMGRAADSAIPALSKKLLASKDNFKNKKSARPVITEALERIDPRRRELMDLSFDLKQKNPIIRYRAAFYLSEIETPTIGAVEMLVDALPDPDVYTSARAMVGLVRIGLDKTERLKKIAVPRIKSAVARAEAAKIEGFDEIVQPALKNLP